MSSLTEYLLARGISLDPTEIDNDPVLADEELLKEVVSVWGDHKDALKKIIEARVRSIASKRVLDGTGYDTIIYKQAMVEVAAIISDFQSYSEELSRRRKGKEGAESRADAPIKN